MVNGQCVLDGARLAREATALGRMECSLYQRRNASKTEPMRQEFANGDFVRGVEHGRSATAGSQRRPRQRERGKPDQTGMLECKGRISRPSEDAKQKAKEQAERITTIEGAAPIVNAGCVTFFKRDVLQFFWRDPTPDPDRIKHPIQIEYPRRAGGITTRRFWRSSEER